MSSGQVLWSCRAVRRRLSCKASFRACVRDCGKHGGYFSCAVFFRAPVLILLGVASLVSGIPASVLEGVTRGAVVRGYQMTKILLYTDAGGRSWVGLREWRPGSGWTITQPIFGPVTKNGLRFSYFDSGGGRAASPNSVARIPGASAGRP